MIPLASIQIEPTTVDDLKAVLAIEHAPENQKFVMPYDQDQHEEVLASEDERHFKVLNAQRKVIGYIILAGLENAHRSVELRRIVIVEKGKGYGRQALRWIKAYVFGKLAAHRLWLDVFTFNERARNLYESEGFTVEGTLRECYKTKAGFQSLHLMSILANEYNR